MLGIKNHSADVAHGAQDAYDRGVRDLDEDYELRDTPPLVFVTSIGWGRKGCGQPMLGACRDTGKGRRYQRDRLGIAAYAAWKISSWTPSGSLK